MDVFEKLIENPLFFKWIYFPTEDIESYWGEYLIHNPENAEKILEFKRLFQKQMKYRDDQLNDRDKKRLAQSIYRKLEEADRKKKRSFKITRFIKYAAVALLFFTIGSIAVYLFLDHQNTLIFADNSLPLNAQNPVLIIDGSQKINLNQGKSELDYSGEDEIVIDKQKMLNKKKQPKVPEMNTLVIPYGNHSVITLSDGSQVWLNAGSRLIYPSEFTYKTREVYLVGEAYFEVQKNEKQPFVVKTSDIEINVLGTHFNVSAYPEDLSIQTVLAEGSVEINSLNSGRAQRNIVLEPGQMGYFQKQNKETKVYEVEVEEYILWTQGLLSFSNTDISRVIKKLERYYSVKIQFEDRMNGSVEITGKLDVTKDITVVFEYLSRLTGFQFEKIGERQYVIK